MGQMVKEETVLPQSKPAVKNHVQKPAPSQMQPIAATPGSTAMGTTPHSQHNSLPPQVYFRHNNIVILVYYKNFLVGSLNCIVISGQYRIGPGCQVNLI